MTRYLLCLVVVLLPTSAWAQLSGGGGSAGGAGEVTNAGTFVVQENGGALTSLQLLDDAIQADSANWTNDSSKGIAIMGVYQATPHTVTDNDFTPFLTTANGRLDVHVNNAAVDVQEDVAETAGGTGPMVLNVMRSTPASSTSTSGDNATFNSSSVGGLWVSPATAPAGGANPLSYTSAGSTEDEHAVCTAACTIYSIMVTNTNAAVRYFRCNNDTAGNTAPGSETMTTNGGGGTLVIDQAIPGAATGGGFVIPLGAGGAAFSTAATCWMVTGAAITDVAEVAANEVKATYTYKQ